MQNLIFPHQYHLRPVTSFCLTRYRHWHKLWILSLVICLLPTTVEANTLFFRPNLIFKQNHHLSFNILNAQESWDFKHLGHATEDIQNIEPFGELSPNQDAYGYSGVLKYAFHIPIFQKWGYFLGSNLGATYHWLRSQQISNLTSILYPGVDVGIVYYMNKRSRVSIDIEWYLERINRLTLFDPNSEQQISLSMNYHSIFDFGGSVEHFIDEHQGIRLEYRTRHIQNLAPEKSQVGSEGRLQDIQINRRSLSLGIGYIYYLG